jgi:hypothetical protein
LKKNLFKQAGGPGHLYLKIKGNIKSLTMTQTIRAFNHVKVIPTAKQINHVQALINIKLHAKLKIIIIKSKISCFIFVPFLLERPGGLGKTNFR